MNPLRSAHRLSRLAGVVAICALELLDERDVALLGVGLRGAGVNFFLPGFLFGFALYGFVLLEACGLGVGMLVGDDGEERDVLRSNMPGAVALEMSSPLATLKRAYSYVKRWGVSLVVSGWLCSVGGVEAGPTGSGRCRYTRSMSPSSSVARFPLMGLREQWE